jgi:hypothetical protein
MRFEHLQWFTVRKETAMKFASFVGLIIDGKMPPHVMQLLQRGTLLPIEKDGGGVRPICVCEVLRKVASKVVLKITRDKIRQYFSPLQLGFAEKGQESLFHEAEVWWKGENTKLGQIDIKKAFNSFSRGQMLRKLKESFPDIYRYARTLYEREQRLLLTDGSFLNSFRGALQGDPLSPFLFALVIHEDLVAVQQEVNTHIVAYIDDITIFDTNLGKIRDALGKLKDRFRELGLEENGNKTRIITDARYGPSQNLQPEGIHTSAVEGFGIMGGFIGTDAFVADKLTEKLAYYEALIGRIVEFGSAGYIHHAYNLLRICMIPKFIALGRKHGDDHPDCRHAFDQAMTTGMATLLGLEPTSMTWWQNATMHLPINLGGFGLTSLQGTAGAMKFNSLHGCRTPILERVRHGRDYGTFRVNFNKLYAKYSSRFYNLINLEEGAFMQKDLLKAIHRDTLKSLIALGFQNDRHSELRSFMLAKLGRFSRWLSISPQETVLKDRDFKLASSVWLGFRHFGACQRCGGKASDLHHHFVCKKGGYVMRRHNHLINIIAKWTKKEGVQVYTEPRGEIGLLAFGEEGDIRESKRPDILFPALNNKRVLLDITFCSPWRTLGGKSRTYKTAINSGVRMKELEKLRMYEKPGWERSKGQHFFPIAIESLGVVGDGFHTFLVELKRCMHRSAYQQMLGEIQHFIFKQIIWALPK